jgi:hypothetical protein
MAELRNAYLQKVWVIAMMSFIDHLKEICNIPNKSTLVKYTDQQEFSVLEHITVIRLYKVKDFATTKNDGTLEA